MKYFDAILKWLFLIGGLALAVLAGLFIGLMLMHRNEIDRMPVSAVPIAVVVQTNPIPSTPEDLYLDLLKKTLTRAQTAGRYTRHIPRPTDWLERYLYSSIAHLVRVGRFEIVGLVPSDPQGYLEGGGTNLEIRQDDAETMVGTAARQYPVLRHRCSETQNPRRSH